ncbi:hypothetical protein TNCV_2422561 [Trichonephila clavipes]|nr:hypothetical protein TNCV_2422561 [Trichonephila clavipes]
MVGANKTCVSVSLHAAAVVEFRLLTGHDSLYTHLSCFNLTDSSFCLVYFWRSHRRCSSRRVSALKCCEEILEISLPNGQAFDK